MRLHDAVDSREIVVGLLEAKPEAFHHFFEAWLPVVLTFARRRTSSEEEAEALARRVLRRALQELPGWRPGTDFAAWMRAVAEVELRVGTPR